MVIDSDSPPANPIADFEEFFRNFEEAPNEFKYRQKISEAYAKSEHFVTILFEDVLNFRPNLANYLRNDPEQALEEAVESFKNIYRIDAGGFFNSDVKYFVRVATQNNSNEVSLRNIRATHIDHMIFVKGIIIRASVVRPQVINASFECPICGNVMQITQSSSKLDPPRDCTNPTCKNTKNFKVLTHDSEFIDHQLITIQEAPEDLQSGAIPQTMQAILLHDLVDSVRPGERIKIMGILKSVPREDKRGRLSTVFFSQLFVNNIEGLNQDDENQDLTQDDIDEITALAKEPKIQNKIARSIARVILGHDHLKLAAALSLFGGVQKIKKDGSKLRGDIHVLLLGDPGTGKSQILQNCAQISPRSIYTSGKGASAAGLTAAVMKEGDNSGMALEAGALVLASGGVACIDEFDKMRRQDRTAIHEAMEQQTVSIAKAGIVATLQAKTAIIAAANTKNGRWNDYDSAAANINLSPPILSRFDLIFVVRDIPAKAKDDQIAQYILQNHMEGFDEMYDESDGAKKEGGLTALQRDFISMDLLKKYIRYCKNNAHPKLTKAAAERIRKYYVKVRSQNPENPTAVSIVARNLDGMVRLSEAYAKMALRDFVTNEDVEAIIVLEDQYLHDVGYDEETGIQDMDKVLTGTSTSKRKKLTLILDKIKELQQANPRQALDLNDIYEPISSIDGISEQFVRQALEQWHKEGTLISPRDGKYKLVNMPKVRNTNKSE